MNNHTPISDTSAVSTPSGTLPPCFDAAPAHGAVASVLAPADTKASSVSTSITEPAQIDTRYQRAAQLLVRCALPRLQLVEADGAPEPTPPAHRGVASADVGDADFAAPNHSPSPLIAGAISTAESA